MALASFVDVLIAWPSLAELARDLSVPAMAVQSWRRRGSIPERHWTRLIQAARRRGIRGISLDRLHALAALDAEPMRWDEEPIRGV